MKYTDIIWDFNGTIIDDVDTGISSVNTMLAERGLQTIPDKDTYRRIFHFPIVEYYRDLGFDFDKEPYEVLAPIWVELYLENAKEAPLQPYVREAIDFFSAAGASQHVLSASELGMLKSQLEGFGILHRFESISGLDNIHAHSKSELARVWRAAHPAARVLVIGDTEHDYDTARLLCADCALICGGHQTRERLLECESAKVYDSLRDLCDFLSKQ